MIGGSPPPMKTGYFQVRIHLGKVIYAKAMNNGFYWLTKFNFC